MRTTPSRSRIVPLALVLALAAAVAGCASSGSSVTPRAGSTRTISVGQEVVVRLPASLTTREWRLTEFDSKKLPISVRLRVERPADGGAAEWVGRFVARAPGQANIEYTRVAVAAGADGFVGERRRFGFRIRE